MAILKDTTYCSTRHLRAILPVLFTAFAFRLASAQPLSVSPVSADLGRFPAWKSQTQTFAVRNTGESTVHLLRVRSSCGCLAADFQPCTLEAGQKTAVTVTIPANSVSGEFSRKCSSAGKRSWWGVSGQNSPKAKNEGEEFALNNNS